MSYLLSTGGESVTKVYGKFNCSTANLLQDGFEFRKTNSLKIKKDSPIDKKIILVTKYPRRSIIRKSETFCKSLYENNTVYKNFGHNKRILNSISFKIFLVKSSFHCKEEPLLKLEVKEMLRKEAIRKPQPS